MSLMATKRLVSIAVAIPPGSAATLAAQDGVWDHPGVVELVPGVFVAREAEFGVLERAAAGCRDGGGSALVVAGEAGVGKSRLLAEASLRARGAGMLVLRGRAAPGAGQAPFRAVAEALAGGLRERVVSEASLRSFAPALAHILPGWFEPTNDRAPELVFLAEGVLLLLRLLAGSRGVVLGLEDLQWADPESLALVEYLAENVGTERLLLVGTVRDDEPSAPLVSLRELARRGPVRWLELARLARDEVLELATARLGSAVPSLVSELLQARAEGLPLFVEELLGGLIASGALRREGEEWQPADRIGLSLPSSFVASVGERVAALTAPTPLVLAAAAVLGRSFDTALLSACTGLSGSDVSAALRACADARLVEADRELGMDGMRFRHALVRDAVLERTPPTERRALAGGALAAVEAAHRGLPGGWCGLAVELAQLAGRDDRAIALLRVASERARDDGALGAAVEALERAVMLADESAGRVVQLELLESLVAAGRFERARELGERLSFGPGGEAEEARVHLALAQSALIRVDWDEAERRLDAARARAGSTLGERLELLAASIAVGRDRFTEAERIARSVAVRAGARGDDGTACEAWLLAGESASAADVQRAEGMFSRALALAEHARVATLRARALSALGGLDVLRVGSHERVALAREAALEAGMAALAAASTHDLAMLSLLRFELEDARAWARQTVVLGRRYRLGWVLAAGLIKEAWAAALTGSPEEAERLLAEAEPIVGGNPRGCALMDGHVRAAVALGRENLDAAWTAVEGAAELWWRQRLEPRPYLGLWVLLAALTDPSGFEPVRERLEQRRVLWQPTIAGLCLAAQAARIVAADEDLAGADALLARAEPLLEPTPWFRAVAYRHVGERLLSAGSPTGERLLGAAIAFFAGAGIRPPTEAARALLRAAGRPVPRRGRGHATVPTQLATAGVSSREMDVLLLLAEGLTNRQIAARLYLSPRTVEKHVERLLAKTDSPNRVALAAHASSPALT
jgi:DNA-binding CsgD family transcriptional regulator/DNA-binding transcriptional ArsR family regulator